MTDTVFPANDDWLARDPLRTWVKGQARTGDFIASGFVLTDGGGLNASLSAGIACVGGAYVARDVASTIGLTASSTNHIFIGPDETALDTLTITVNTTGTPPAGSYIKVGTVATGVAAISTGGITNYRPRVSIIYDRNDTTGAPQTGDLITEGLCTPTDNGINNSANANVAALPGVVGNQGTEATGTAAAILTLFSPGSAQIPALIRGTKLTIRGRYKAFSDTPMDGTKERFAIGIVQTATITSLTTVANETETTRDDLASVVAVVDDSENIKSYNCAAAGDASYTDSTFDADLSVGTDFEVIVENPTTGNSLDDVFVTIKMRDNGGTLRTILNAVHPTATSTGETHVVALFNQSGLLYDLTYKVEIAA